MSTICTLRYNPYSNRDKMGFNTWSAYQTYGATTFTGINFNPADGVNTELVLGGPTTQAVDTNANYLLVGTDGANPTIESRWFIMDCDRTRGGQYNYKLYRDVVYDNLTAVLSAKAFIEKGWITSTTSPYLFNQEGINTNQVKIKETLIKDRTNVPWIVGYLAKDAPGGRAAWSGTTSAIVITDEQFKTLYGDDGFKEFYDDSTLPESFTSIYKTQTTGTFSAGQTFQYGVGFSESNGMVVNDWLGEQSYFHIAGSTEATIRSNAQSLANELYTYYIVNRSDYIGALNRMIPIREKYSNYSEYNGINVIHDGTVYSVQFIASTQKRVLKASLNDLNWLTRIANKLSTSSYVLEGAVSPNQLEDNVTVVFKTKICKMVPVQVGEYHVDMPEGVARLSLSNQPYQMFCMPYQNAYYAPDGATNFTLNGNIDINIAQAISAKYSGTASLVDIQLLPYCPLQSKLRAIGGQISINGTLLKSGQAVPIKNSAEQTVSYLFFCEEDSFSFSTATWTQPAFSTSEDIKIVSQAYKCRIVSPNYAASFEFNPAMIGDVHGENTISVNCTYKPFAPTICLRPIYAYGSLYGTTVYNDARGLICSGDFSLPQLNDSWQTFQINNKNYEAAFQRQIESIELNNKYAKIQDVTNAITGAAGAAVSGGITGAVIGGPVGAGIGAAVGGIASGVAGAVDVSINEKLRADQLDLKKDLYNYNLQNIQAQPTTISKVGAVDIINKLFPFVEDYDCTAAEKTAISNKLKYNGMSIGVIDTLSAYASVGHFIKGELIHIALNDDYHMANAIREELKVGFYYGGVS